VALISLFQVSLRIFSLRTDGIINTAMRMVTSAVGMSHFHGIISISARSGHTWCLKCVRISVSKNCYVRWLRFLKEVNCC